MTIAVNSCLIPADQIPGPSVVCGCDPTVTACQEWNWMVKYDPVVYRSESTMRRKSGA